MSEKDKAAGRAIANALKHLPDDRKNYFFGFADGVEAAVNAQKKEKEDDDAEADRNDGTGEGG